MLQRSMKLSGLMCLQVTSSALSTDFYYIGTLNPLKETQDLPLYKPTAETVDPLRQEPYRV